MTQSKSRRLLYQQARLIRIQWAVILALVCTIILMAIFLPKAKAVEETAAPTLELEPTSYVTPEIMPEPIIETEPVLEELGEFRLTAYCACRKCCGKDPLATLVMALPRLARSSRPAERLQSIPLLSLLALRS